MKKKWVLLSVLFAVCFSVFGFSVRAEEASYSYPPKSEWTDAKYFEFDATTDRKTSLSLRRLAGLRYSTSGEMRFMNRISIRIKIFMKFGA